MLEEYNKDILDLLKAIICIDIVAFLACCVAGWFGLPLVLGFVVGIVLIMLDFCLIVRHTVNALKAKNPNRRAKLGYAFRFGLIALTLGLCFYHPYINQWVVCVHMFYPKVIYTVKAIMKKGV